MLDIRTRQVCLKELGMYNGAIDGIEGKGTKAGYKLLQDKYFTRAKDRDGVYGNNTDILLQCAYNVHHYSKHFKLEEFKCKCGAKYCTGYPAVIDPDLPRNLESMRAKYGSIGITSGLRCKTWNRLVGGVNGSAHTKGKASDIYNRNINGTLNNRKNAIEYFLTLPISVMGYCNGYMHWKGSSPKNYKSKTMGIAVHLQVK